MLYLVLFLIYFPMAASCYFSLGTNVTDNIVLAMSDGWQRITVEIMLLLHLVTAYPIITNPPAQFFEQMLNIPSGEHNLSSHVANLSFRRFQLEALCLPFIVSSLPPFHCWDCSKFWSNPWPGWSLYCHSSYLRLPSIFLHEACGCQPWQEGVGWKVTLDQFYFVVAVQLYLWHLPVLTISWVCAEIIFISGSYQFGRGSTVGPWSSLVWLEVSVPQSLLSITSSAAVSLCPATSWGTPLMSPLLQADIKVIQDLNTY